MVNVMKPEGDMYNANYQPMANCIPQELEIKGVRLAAAYVPFQKLCTLFPPVEALKRGTAFPELFSPYEKHDKKCMKDMRW